MQIDPGVLDRLEPEIPPDLYCTKDFERGSAILDRTETVARLLNGYLNNTNRMDKTIVDCVDQDHTVDMRNELNKMTGDLQVANYFERVVPDEGPLGRGHSEILKVPGIVRIWIKGRK